MWWIAGFEILRGKGWGEIFLGIVTNLFGSVQF